jgi:hypothetical protein
MASNHKPKDIGGKLYYFLITFVAMIAVNNTFGKLSMKLMPGWTGDAIALCWYFVTLAIALRIVGWLFED